MNPRTRYPFKKTSKEGLLELVAEISASQPHWKKFPLRQQLSSAACILHSDEFLETCDRGVRDFSNKVFPILCLGGAAAYERNQEWIALHNINFSGSSLRGAQFLAVDFSGADFRNANLRDVEFCGILHNVDFRGADLTRAIFNCCAMQGVKLQGATLVDTDLTDLCPSRHETGKEDFYKVDLDGVDLSRIEFVPGSCCAIFPLS